MAQELTTRADACFAVEFKSAIRHEEVAPFGREKAPVGLGHFTVESDRQIIAPVKAWSGGSCTHICCRARFTTTG